MKNHPLPFAFLLFLLFLIACDQEGCQKWQQVATKVKDTDGDGWMDEATNQKIGGLFNGIIPNMTAIMNAFKRPLDYSPTQWNNIDVASSRN